MSRREKILAYFAWLSVCIIWGTTFLAIRVGVQDLPPMLFIGLRWLFAGLFFALILRFRKIPFPDGKDLINAAIPGILLLGVSNGLVVVAVQWLPSGLTALILTTTPIVIFCLELCLPDGPGFNYRVFLGLLCGFSGVALVFISEKNDLFQGTHPAAFFLLLLAMISWGVGTLYSKYKKTNVHPLMSATIQMLVAGVGQTLIGFLMGEYPRFVFTPSSLSAFLYLLFIASMMGYGSYIYAINKLPISFVSTHSYINPVIALFLGWLILDERLGVFTIVAAGIILIGVFMVKRGLSHT